MFLQTFGKQEGLVVTKTIIGSIPSRGLSVWSSHVLLLLVWVSSRYSSFLPQSKNIRVGLTGDSNLLTCLTKLVKYRLINEKTLLGHFCLIQIFNTLFSTFIFSHLLVLESKLHNEVKESKGLENEKKTNFFSTMLSDISRCDLHFFEYVNYL